MKFPWKNGLVLLFATWSLAGCTPQGEDAARGVAASFVAARAFDRASPFLQPVDSAQVERARHAMRRVNSANPRLIGALVSGLSIEANRLFQRSQRIRGDEKSRLEENSNANYRAALAFTPQKSPQKSLDAHTLNALGYFLADKGSTRADFERAAVLTRAAYQNWDLSGKSPDSDELGRAISAQDSYAWALFKLGRYEEALAQQKKVWDIARGMGLAEVPADVPFHLGEIYRALGQDKAARLAYEAALELTISDETRVLVEGGLKLLDLARV